MKRYNVYISRIYTFSPIIEAGSYEQAIEKAQDIADNLEIMEMIFADESVEVEERRVRYGKNACGKDGPLQGEVQIEPERTG